jgi:hypothetical protein
MVCYEQLKLTYDFQFAFLCVNSKRNSICSFFRVLLGINPSGGSKIAKCRIRKLRSGVHDGVLSLIRELALFTELEH